MSLLILVSLLAGRRVVPHTRFVIRNALYIKPVLITTRHGNKLSIEGGLATAKTFMQ